MSVQKKTTTPTAMLARLERTSQPRPSRMGEPIAVPRPMIPRASENAPKTMTSASRLMFGQTRIRTPTATASAPLIPSAQRAFVTCDSTRCRKVSSVVSI
jgi:hypothetical protein